MNANPNYYLKQIEVGPMANFTYLIGDPVKREVFIVDPAWQIDTIFSIAQKENLTITGALVTHGHFDHCNGVEDLLERKNVPIYVNKEEIRFLDSIGPRADQLFGSFPKESLKAVSSGDKVKIGDVELTLIHTPGHTPGSQCFLLNNNLLTGDTLFVRGCGRCDLPGGDPKQMYESLTQKLLKLPDDTVVLPGHFYSEEPTSRMKEEKTKNPYLICNNLETFLNLLGLNKEML